MAESPGRSRPPQRLAPAAKAPVRLRPQPLVTEAVRSRPLQAQLPARLRSLALRFGLLAICLLFVFAGPASAALTIRVQGNQLVNSEQRPLRLLGVNFSGAEYACIQNKGIWSESGPANQATIEAMAAWHINAVRIPLNEDCWLGINGAPGAYSGAGYQQAIHEFVQSLHAAGIYVILDLQWSAPASHQALGLQPMADLGHSLEFWRSVALSFREDPAVLFDLYSEPHGISWECWLNGCTLSEAENGTWQTAGMQSLVDAVRSAGATQPLLLGGLEWANDLSGWREHLPVDSEHQLVASVHVYPNNPCNADACWSSTLAAIARSYPVVAGEIGEFDCQSAFIEQFMNWADANGVSYLGWSWNTYECSAGPALIANVNGEPTAFGAGLRAHLQATSPWLVNSPPPPEPEPVTVTSTTTTSTASTPAPSGASVETPPVQAGGPPAQAGSAQPPATTVTATSTPPLTPAPAAVIRTRSLHPTSRHARRRTQSKSRRKRSSHGGSSHNAAASHVAHRAHKVGAAPGKRSDS
jgi:hypothetical protein